MSTELASLQSAVAELSNQMANVAKYTSLVDQIKILRGDKNRVLEEERWLRLREAGGGAGSAESRLVTGLIGLLLGCAFGSPTGEKDRVQNALSMTAAHYRHKDPYNTVLIAVKVGRGLENCHAVSISQMARESKSSETCITASLRSQGWNLMSLAEFNKYAEELEDKLKAQMNYVDPKRFKT
jgi:hypothetical protein